MLVALAVLAVLVKLVFVKLVLAVLVKLVLVKLVLAVLVKLVLEMLLELELCAVHLSSIFYAVKRRRRVPKELGQDAW